MKCPHCGKDITKIDKMVTIALEATTQQPISDIKYQSQSVGVAAQGTFIVNGELREFEIVWDDSYRLASFTQRKR